VEEEAVAAGETVEFVEEAGVAGGVVLAEVGVDVVEVGGAGEDLYATAAAAAAIATRSLVAYGIVLVCHCVSWFEFI